MVPLFESAPFKPGDMGTVLVPPLEGASNCEVSFDTGPTVKVALRHLEQIDELPAPKPDDDPGLSKPKLVDESERPSVRNRKATKYLSSDEERPPARNKASIPTTPETEKPERAEPRVNGDDAENQPRPSRNRKVVRGYSSSDDEPAPKPKPKPKPNSESNNRRVPRKYASSDDEEVKRDDEEEESAAPVVPPAKMEDAVQRRGKVGRKYWSSDEDQPTRAQNKTKPIQPAKSVKEEESVVRPLESRVRNKTATKPAQTAKPVEEDLSAPFPHEELKISNEPSIADTAEMQFRHEEEATIMKLRRELAQQHVLSNIGLQTEESLKRQLLEKQHLLEVMEVRMQDAEHQTKQLQETEISIDNVTADLKLLTQQLADANLERSSLTLHVDTLQAKLVEEREAQQEVLLQSTRLRKSLQEVEEQVSYLRHQHDQPSPTRMEEDEHEKASFDHLKAVWFEEMGGQLRTLRDEKKARENHLLEEINQQKAELERKSSNQSFPSMQTSNSGVKAKMSSPPQSPAAKWTAGRPRAPLDGSAYIPPGSADLSSSHAGIPFLSSSLRPRPPMPVSGLTTTVTIQSRPSVPGRPVPLSSACLNAPALTGQTMSGRMSPGPQASAVRNSHVPQPVAQTALVL